MWHAAVLPTARRAHFYAGASSPPHQKRREGTAVLTQDGPTLSAAGFPAIRAKTLHTDKQFVPSVTSVSSKRTNTLSLSRRHPCECQFSKMHPTLDPKPEETATPGTGTEVARDA